MEGSRTVGMGRRGTAGPTRGELEILQVFWNREVCTVRDVQSGRLTAAVVREFLHDEGEKL